MTNIAPAIERFRRDTDAPAVLAATIDRDGGFEVEAVGIRRRDEPSTVVSIDDQVHIGSCGKAMTSALYARLVEAGLAEWGVPLGSLFNDLSDVDPTWRDVTIDDLLQCRAGIAPNPPITQMRRLHEATEPMAEQRTAAAQTVLSNAANNPGTFVYSNLSYVVAGAVIDRIAGVPFEEAMRSYVTEPLDMESFGYGAPSEMAGHRPTFSLGPVVIGKGNVIGAEHKYPDNPALLTPAGRYHLTLHDWARFITVILRNGDGFLTSDSIERLTTMPTSGSDGFAMGWADAQHSGGSIAMQGSNTLWSATVFIDEHMTIASLVAVNDGRRRILENSAHLAHGLVFGTAPT